MKEVPSLTGIRDFYDRVVVKYSVIESKYR